MGEARARLFVALDLPDEVRAALLAWRAPLLAGAEDALRAVPEEALHVTLCFLGALPVREVGAIGAAVERVSGRAGRPREPGDRAGSGRGGGGSDADAAPAVGGLALGAPLWLPRRRPHALAVAVEDGAGALGRLQGALAGALADGGWLKPEERRFLPHVTVARVRRGVDPRALARRELPAPRRLAFAGTAVTLHRSHLGRGGARYEALARVALGG